MLPTFYADRNFVGIDSQTFGGGAHTTAHGEWTFKGPGGVKANFVFLQSGDFPSGPRSTAGRMLDRPFLERGGVFVGRTFSPPGALGGRGITDPVPLPPERLRFHAGRLRVQLIGGILSTWPG